MLEISKRIQTSPPPDWRDSPRDGRDVTFLGYRIERNRAAV